VTNAVCRMVVVATLSAFAAGQAGGGDTDAGPPTTTIGDLLGDRPMVDGGDRPTLEAAGHVAANNHVHHYARLQRTYRPAVEVKGVGNRVTHNHIHHAPHNGILHNVPMAPVAAGFLPAAELVPDATVQVGKPAPTRVAAGFLPAGQLVPDAIVQVGKPAPTREQSWYPMP